MIAVPLVFALSLRLSLIPIGSASAMGAFGSEPALADSEALQPVRFDASRFDSTTAIALQSILDTATAHRIPVGPLISKALQGAALHSPSAKILNVVRALYLAMVDARAALGESSTPDELASGADAIRAGIDGKALVAFRGARSASGSAVTALVVATDLIKRGIPINKAGDAVAALARVSKTDDTINALQKLVAKNAERGPGMAQDALDRYVKTNAPGNSTPAGTKPVTRPPGPPDES